MNKHHTTTIILTIFLILLAGFVWAGFILFTFMGVWAVFKLLMLLFYIISI